MGCVVRDRGPFLLGSCVFVNFGGSEDTGS